MDNPDKRPVSAGNTVQNALKPLKRIVSSRGMGQVLTVTAGLIVLFIVFSALNPLFYSGRNVSNLLRQIAPILMIGIGQSYVLITGNIDLSIGSLIGMSCMMSATMMTKGVNPWLSACVTLVACLAVGFLNGQLVARFKLPPFIATLGTMTVARGIAQLVNNNRNTNYIGVEAEGFRNFFYYGDFPSFSGSFTLYNAVWIAVIMWAVFYFILSRTKLGRHTYAVGSNLEAARLSGVSVVSTTTTAYMISAFCACIAGLFMCSVTGTGTMDAGTSYELYAVAASVIGGVSTLGGQGILLGTVVGATIWVVLDNGLQFAGAPTAFRNITIGAIVVFSVLLDVIVRTSGRKRRNRKIESKT